MKRLLRHSIYTLIAFFAVGCAQIISPTGGDKDETPPVLLAATPENQTTQFSAKSFTLEFDEYVQLNDVANELLISPPLEKSPVVTIRKKTVIVEFEEELKEQTTYNFNFGDAIRDVNEGNIVQLNYVLSTGSKIDSLSLAGLVVDAYTNSPAEGVKIMLYEGFEDSLPLTSRPSFFGKSNAEGKWEINYLKEGNYKIFALKEDFGNYMYDNPSEWIGFLTDTLTPSYNDSLQSQKIFKLRLANEGKEPQLINSWKSDSSGHVVMSLVHPKERLYLEFPNSEFKEEEVVQQKLAGDSLHLWFLGPPLEKKIDVIIFDDSVLLDTIEVKFFKEKSPAKFDLKCPPQGFDASIGLSFETSFRIDSIDKKRMILLEDSSSINFSTTLIESNCREFKLDSKFKDGMSYSLEILPGALMSDRQAANDTLKCSFKSYPTEYFGKLEFELDVPDAEGQYILQFTDKSDKLVYEFELIGNSIITFEKMIPASYKLRLIDDVDLDGQWTSLDYSRHRQAEKVYYFAEELLVRSNWEQKLKWSLDLNR